MPSTNVYSQENCPNVILVTLNCQHSVIVTPQVMVTFLLIWIVYSVYGSPARRRFKTWEHTFFLKHIYFRCYPRSLLHVLLLVLVIVAIDLAFPVWGKLTNCYPAAGGIMTLEARCLKPLGMPCCRFPRLLLNFGFIGPQLFPVRRQLNWEMLRPFAACSPCWLLYQPGQPGC